MIVVNQIHMNSRVSETLAEIYELTDQQLKGLLVHISEQIGCLYQLRDVRQLRHHLWATSHAFLSPMYMLDHVVLPHCKRHVVAQPMVRNLQCPCLLHVTLLIGC